MNVIRVNTSSGQIDKENVFNIGFLNDNLLFLWCCFFIKPTGSQDDFSGPFPVPLDEKGDFTLNLGDGGSTSFSIFYMFKVEEVQHGNTADAIVVDTTKL